MNSSTQSMAFGSAELFACSYAVGLSGLPRDSGEASIHRAQLCNAAVTNFNSDASKCC